MEKRATATILSACPKHHPVNTAQCCQYKNDAYCTCIIQDTIDLNAKPYAALGGQNGFSSQANWGACGSQLASLKIDIHSSRASQLVQPFLTSGKWCNSKIVGPLTGVNQNCDEILDQESCNAVQGCTFCNATGFVASKCYGVTEAASLLHILTTEQGEGVFQCAVKPVFFGDMIDASKD